MKPGRKKKLETIRNGHRNRLSDLQIATLIHLIEKNPITYNKITPGTKQERLKLWKEFAKTLNISERDMRLTWKSLRSKYYRAKRIMDIEKKPTKFAFFPLLQFLPAKPSEAKPSMSQSVTSEQENSIGDEKNEEDESMSQVEETTELNTFKEEETQLFSLNDLMQTTFDEPPQTHDVVTPLNSNANVNANGTNEVIQDGIIMDNSRLDNDNNNANTSPTIPKRSQTTYKFFESLAASIDALEFQPMEIIELQKTTTLF